MSYNLEIPITMHLRRVVPKPEVLLFVRKNFINETGRSQGHIQRGSKRPPRVSAHQPLRYFLTPLPAPSTSTMRSPENMVEEYIHFIIYISVNTTI